LGFRSAVTLFLSLLCSPPMFATEKATSLPDAQAAVENNLRTPEGKTYDEKIGNEFLEKPLDEVRQCKKAGKDDLRSFWFLLKFDKEGKVREVLLYPATSLGVCAREALLKDIFSPPPRPDYWVSVYLKLDH
jgi:hypothetical protein